MSHRLPAPALLSESNYPTTNPKLVGWYDQQILNEKASRFVLMTTNRQFPAAVELNLDGLVGPTHHYGGLGLGNLASQKHRHQVSNPRAAALEGLAKMRLLISLGIPQAVLPPQQRPLVPALRQLGFGGTDATVLAAAAEEAPALLSAASSTSSMWAANAASVSPGADTADGRLHLTPANLVSQWHRSLETPFTTQFLGRIFADPEHFCRHPPLPAAIAFADEGAANQMRLAPSHGATGTELFVYGREPEARSAGRYPARQSRAASKAVARLHGLTQDRVVLLQQSPQAIDAGVFHNDVIAVANENVLLVHQQAFAEGQAALHTIRSCYETNCGAGLTIIEVTEKDIPLTLAIETYLFNSQLVSLPAGGMALICPAECRDNQLVSDWLDRLLAGDNPVQAVYPVSVRQSMQNGGGPACLRLRVVLSEPALAAMHEPVLLSPRRLDRLETWVNQHYRDRLTTADLADPALLEESYRALDELTGILELPALYPFQRSSQ